MYRLFISISFYADQADTFCLFVFVKQFSLTVVERTRTEVLELSEKLVELKDRCRRIPTM